MKKPKANYGLECRSEEYDDKGGGAFCVTTDIEFCCYSAKEVRAAIKWLQRAEKWIAHKELYLPRGRKPKEPRKEESGE